MNEGSEPVPLVDHAGLEVLSPEICLGLVASAVIGRVGFVDSGDPVILPVRIGVWGKHLVFTTARGSKLDAAIMERPVAVEVDDWDAATETGWSVLVKGVAQVVDDGREIDSLDRLSVHAWTRPDIPKAWVRVVPEEITGRRILPPPTLGGTQLSSPHWARHPRQ
ncbi:MAG: pyridoxamine 5'-phosphate oxidase family protein [Microthrixaceae bacterium]|nr:pyridoxamine 5'-phosphate oxidase family protein [Microthrixaceae bacterium]